MTGAASAVVYRIPAGLLVVGLLLLAFAIFVIVDMARRPGWQWQQAGSSKPLWLTLEIVVVLVPLISFLSWIVGIVYLAAVRPKLRAAERQGPMSPQWPSQAGWPSQGGWPAGEPQAPPIPSTGGLPAYPGTVAETPKPTFGWYPDPSGAHERRYWDGTTWTEHVADGEQRSIDPLPN